MYQQSIAAPNGVRLFPVQGIESAGLFVLFIVLSILALRNHGKRVHVVYFIAYALLRFILEFFRGDTERGMLGFLSTSQIIGIGLILGILSFVSFFDRAKGKSRCPQSPRAEY